MDHFKNLDTEQFMHLQWSMSPLCNTLVKHHFSTWYAIFFKLQQCNTISCYNLMLFINFQSADAIVKGRHPAIFRQCHVDPFRGWVLQAFRQHCHENEEEVCGMPNCTLPSGKSVWIQCDECERWLHCVCLGGNVSTDGAFTCPLCPSSSPAWYLLC